MTYTPFEAILKLRYGVIRKVTRDTAMAFLLRQPRAVGNTHTDGDAYYLHGNKIAEWRDGVVWITDAGWQTLTTRERLNAFLPGALLYGGGGERHVNPNGSVGRGHTIRRCDGTEEQWNGEWRKTDITCEAGAD